MNSSELRKLLIQVSHLPLEKLSSAEIKRVASLSHSIIDSLDKVQIISKVEQLNNSLALEDRPFYDFLLRKNPTKRPTNAAKKGQWEKYYQSLRLYHEKIKKQKIEYSRLLEKLQKSNEESSLKMLNGLKPDQKKLLAMLASLTSKNGRGVKSLVLGNSRSSQLKWLHELKNVRQLGILANENEELEI